MRLSPNTLQLDIKVEDRYRKWFSGLGIDSQLKASCVILGDSDIDYELAPNVENSRILSTPYSVEGIKHKLIYNGVGKNLAGSIKCFARKVNSDGTLSSLYDYPANDTFTAGVTPPTLNNGKNWEKITFDDTKMGFVLYFSTVLDFYLTDEDVKKRINEEYTITFDWNGSSVTPASWDYKIDNVNGSLLLAKQDTTSSPVSSSYLGKITITGTFSNKVKEVKFNF
jgi:hypothetical protein